MSRLNRLGGVIPETQAEAKRAAEADLITLPKKVEGTNCFNCAFITGKGAVRYCRHPNIRQNVSIKNCCALWDAHGVIRV